MKLKKIIKLPYNIICKSLNRSPLDICISPYKIYYGTEDVDIYFTIIGNKAAIDYIFFAKNIVGLELPRNITYKDKIYNINLDNELLIHYNYLIENFDFNYIIFNNIKLIKTNKKWKLTKI